MTYLRELLSLYVVVVFGRVVLSWFPISPGSAMAGVYGFLHQLTEPVLGPIRRILPPLGGFDLSPLVLIMAIYFVQGALR